MNSQELLHFSSSGEQVRARATKPKGDSVVVVCRSVFRKLLNLLPLVEGDEAEDGRL